MISLRNQWWVTMERMKRISLMLYALIISVQGIIVSFVFNNPYPCTLRGCGCESVWEMLADTWPDMYMIVSVLVAVLIAFKILTVGEIKDGS